MTDNAASSGMTAPLPLHRSFLLQIVAPLLISTRRPHATRGEDEVFVFGMLAGMLLASHVITTQGS